MEKWFDRLYIPFVLLVTTVIFFMGLYCVYINMIGIKTFFMLAAVSAGSALVQAIIFDIYNRRV